MGYITVDLGLGIRQVKGWFKGRWLPAAAGRDFKGRGACMRLIQGNGGVYFWKNTRYVRLMTGPRLVNHSCTGPRCNLQSANVEPCPNPRAQNQTTLSRSYIHTFDPKMVIEGTKYSNMEY